MTGVYIHVPFCLKKCPYCDFFSLKYSEEEAENYTKAVIRNLNKKMISADTVYFGGGTPSLLTPKQIDRILSCIDLAYSSEITMECNPVTSDKNAFLKIYAAGINRISLGVQSFSDRELSALGRRHTAAEAEKAILDISAAKFENISADIMLGIPYQTEKTLAKTFDRLLKLPVNHISAYMLKVENGTPLAKDSALLKKTADDETLADMYLMTCERLEAAGFGRYEISNFARENFECRHNLKYWRGENYIGIGPSAHSYIDGRRFSVPDDLRSFIESEEQNELITDETAGSHDERFMLEMRTSDGIAYSDYDDGGEIAKKAVPIIQAGLLAEENGRLFFTDRGAVVSNDIIARLLG